MTENFEFCVMETRTKDKDLKGWLRRKGGRMNTWSRRYFVLKDKFLFIFAKEEDRKSQECITLDGQIIIEPTPELNDPRRGYFDIVTESGKAPTETLSLCAETDEEKNVWVRALKRALYADIGGAVFSQSLEEILFWEKKAGRTIPYIVDESIEYLYKYGLDVEGIFRLPGRQSVIKDTMARFERGEKIKFEDEGTDINVVASVLKTFLRTLPDSIIPCEFFQKFMNIALRFMEAPNTETKEKCVEELAEGMTVIPKDNYVILKYICNFLREVGLHEPTNKMSMMSLGTVFGYNLIRHIDKENSQLFLCTADLGQNLVYMLLNFYPQVFMLEYSDKGDTENNVPTADLLRMSRVLDVPSAIPTPPATLSLIAELDGIDLNSVGRNTPSNSSKGSSSKGSGSSLRMAEGHFSPVELRKKNFHLSYDSNDDDSVFVSSTEVDERKKGLNLKLPGQSELSRSMSTPTSPNNWRNSSPPVPPRRIKSRKIQRNRNLSDRKRPDTIAPSMSGGDRSPRSPMTPEAVNSEDVIRALAKVNSQNNSPNSSPASTLSRGSYYLDPDDIPVGHPTQVSTLAKNGNFERKTSSEETPLDRNTVPYSNDTAEEKEEPFVEERRNTLTDTSGEIDGTLKMGGGERKEMLLDEEGKVGPSRSDLCCQVAALKKELTDQRDRYKNQVTALKTQLTDMRQKYEHRIETMEIEFKSKQQELENRWAKELATREAAVANTVKLKQELHRYQMQYGELSPSS